MSETLSPDGGNRRQMNCHATPQLAERIVAFQRRLGITRSAAMCILIEAGLRTVDTTPAQE